MIMKAGGIILLYLLRSTLCIPLSEFYPFGQNAANESNRRLGDGNSITSGGVITDQLYYFYNQFEFILTVSVNGAIFFGQGTDTSYVSNQNQFPLGGGRRFLAPFWADVDTTVAGNVWYRQSSTQALLDRANMQIRNAFPLQPTFTATDLFIVTWDQVGFFDRRSGRTNTFQCVLATDRFGTETYAIYLYADGEIQWTTGDADGGVNGLGGNPAQVGFNRGDGTDFGVIPISGTADVINIASTSNVGVDGMYIFRISDDPIAVEQTCTDMNTGITYQIGETYQRNCSTRCTCRTGPQIDCITVNCPIDGPTCRASGDPHYVTFDGRRYDYQGSCKYVHVERCTNSEFSIEARNFPSRSGRVSIVGEVTVETQGVDILMERRPGRGRPIPVTINMQQASNTDIILFNSSGVEVRRVGSSVHVFLNTIGIRVTWDGRSRVEATVSTTLLNELCGLCGTYNNNQSDDLQRRDGIITTSVVDFGDSWLVPGSCTALAKRDAQGTPGCSTDPAVIQDGQTRCSVLTQGVFSACNNIVDPTPFIEDCEFDFCCCDDTEREDCYCDNLAAYAVACADAGVVLSTWRNFFCPLQCPVGMVYQQCGSFCPPTCDDMDAIAMCQGGCAEGCFCPDGQVLLDGECVDPFVCTACSFMGVLYGEGTQIQPNCTTRCTCQNREFQCEQQTCFADGPTCYAYGDPHYQTFDVRHYNFQGDREYILTSPCDNDEFTVVVGNVAKSTISSSTQVVRISVPGENLEIVLGSGNGGTIMINGDSQLDAGDGSLMLSGGVEVVRSGGHPHVLLGTQGIRVFWDGVNRVEVTVSTSWQGKLCGLCGNYNSDASDDFIGPNGQQINNVIQFVDSWAVNGSSGDALAPAPPCFGTARRIATARCNALQNAVFTPCHATVDPQPFINDCIDDYCIFCEDAVRDDCLCRSLATYASVCTAAGIPLFNWRDTFCPLQCPAGMLFQQCGRLCPQVCGAPAVCNSGCAEGCFCPDGQVSDSNGQCVEPSSCPGIYGDPHFKVPLQSKQVLCYSIQGYPGLAFNLIYNKNFIINAHFVESMGDKNEATWIGKLAVIPQNGNRSDAVIFDSVTQEVIMVGQGSFRASIIRQITVNENGKISVKFTKGLMKQTGNPAVHVQYIKPQACFDVSFHHNHLNVDWNFQYDDLPEMHGLMGQFMTKGLDIDSQKKMLIYPDGHDPVPVTKDTKMIGDSNRPCWKAMNNGVQGEGLIKGNILDYLVSNILEDDFSYKGK